jgi:uncharacterized OsmC-like protein
MSRKRIAAAMTRLEAVLSARPGVADHEEPSAMARWQAGLKLNVSHPNKDLKVLTDLPAEIGGDGEGVTPGWLMRAGLAACAASSILLSSAPGVSRERLRALIERANQRSPVSSALQHGVPLELSIELQD